jgi:hypothetical protein
MDRPISSYSYTHPAIPCTAFCPNLLLMPLEAIVLTQEFLSPTTPLQVQCVAVWNIIAATHKINQNYIYILNKCWSAFFWMQRPKEAAGAWLNNHALQHHFTWKYRLPDPKSLGNHWPSRMCFRRHMDMVHLIHRRNPTFQNNMGRRSKFGTSKLEIPIVIYYV